MPLHHTRDGYNFNADAQTLAIEPGPKPITLGRAELERLGLLFRDDYQLRHMNMDAAKTRRKGRYEMTSKTSHVAWIVMTIMSLALGYVLGVSQSGTLAQEIKIDDVNPKQIPKGSVGPAGRKGIVVYVDVDFRATIESAQHMTALHEVMAEKGWTFVDFEPYVENGDLQGFWVTYVAEGGS